MKNVKTTTVATVLAAFVFVGGSNVASALDCDFGSSSVDTSVADGWNFGINPLTPTVSAVNGAAVFNPQSSAGLSGLNTVMKAGVVLEQSGAIVGFAQYGVGYKLTPGAFYSAAAAIRFADGTIVIGGYSNTYLTVPSGVTKGNTLVTGQPNTVRLLPGEMRFPKNGGTQWILLTNGTVGRIVNASCQEQNPVTYGVAKSCFVSHTTVGYETTYNPTANVLGRTLSTGIRCAAGVYQVVNGFGFSVKSSWNSLLWK